MSKPGEVSVRAWPGAETWAGLAVTRFRSLSAEQRSTRAELGLPTDRPIVMTGHQAGFWHPGILSKYIAADRLARTIGGTAAAVVVDHDVVDPLHVQAVKRANNGHVKGVAFSLRPRVEAAVLPRLEPPIGEQELKRLRAPVGLIESDGAGVSAIIGTLDRHRDAESLAAQAAAANAEMLQPWMRVELYTAERLVRTDAWQRFFVMAAEDPAGCAKAYNRAVGLHPEAGIPPLFAMMREERWELPFWLLDDVLGRRRLFAEMIEQPGFEPARLATRAMSLTASLRRDLCDLFIHGTGGAIYDRATDEWIRDWLSEDLAPSVSITADVYRDLPIEAMREVSHGDLAQAQWLAHSARHNPDLLGDKSAAVTKRELVDAIRRAVVGSSARLDLYRRMHGWLDTMRGQHRDELDQLDLHAARIEQGLAVQELEATRDWPSVLYPPERLDRLAAAIEELLSL